MHSPEQLFYNGLILFILWVLFKLLRGTYRNCIRKPYNLFIRYKSRDNPWACITGATSGIGLGFVEEFARRGFNVLLVSRSEEKLQDRCKEIRTKYPRIRAEYVVANFGKDPCVEFYENIAAQINMYEISVLVNNAGIMQPCPFTHKEPKNILQTIETNLTPYAMLIRLLLPQMYQRDSKSAIISIASISGSYPNPIIPVYSATKGFGDLFSRSVGLQVGSRVDMISVIALGVTTNLVKVPRNPFFINPTQCAKGVLRHLGYQSLVYGHWNHQLQGFFYQLGYMIIPSSVMNFFNRIIYGKVLLSVIKKNE